MFYILIYILLTEFAFILALPVLYLLLRKIPHAYRLGKYYPQQHYDMLVYAASVGEVNGIRQLLISIGEAYPKLKILLLTNTRSGYQAAENLHSIVNFVISPLDIYHIRLMQLKINKPDLILIAETEIWPMLLYTASLFSVPIVFINARMSEKTFARYSKVKSMLSFAGKSIKKICAQTETDCQRFTSIFSCDCENMGNLKNSIKLPDYDEQSERLRLGYNAKDKIIVLGSSRPGEESLILDCFKKLEEKVLKLKVIIVPRHLNRMNEIRNIFSQEDVSYYSEKTMPNNISVIDEMGLLPWMYSICDIAIIGGSFFPFGGHNPMEAAFYSKKIIIGPFYSSCQGSVDDLIEADAILISNKETLCDDVLKLMENSDTQMGYRAKKVMQANSSSLQKHLDIVMDYLIMNE